MLGHTRQFHHATQSHFTPAASDLRCAERRNEIPRFPLQTQADFCQTPELLFQTAIGCLPIPLHLPHLPFIPVEGILQWSSYRIDGFLSRLEVAPSLRLDGLEGAFRQGNERLIVALQRFGGEGGESVREPQSSFLQELLLPRETRLGLLQPYLGRDPRFSFRLQLVPQRGNLLI